MVAILDLQVIEARLKGSRRYADAFEDVPALLAALRATRTALEALYMDTTQSAEVYKRAAAVMASVQDGPPGPDGAL